MHMVHFSTRYGTIENADFGDDHSIAVLAVMFEVINIIFIFGLVTIHLLQCINYLHRIIIMTTSIIVFVADTLIKSVSKKYS